jgi:4-amino-4-deoxy-L-arabinose transferase-like glycosyltransferase
MKVAHLGFREYNLHHLGREFRADGVTYVLTPDRQGELLSAYIDEGNGSYDQPWFHAPPLFPYLIAFSHTLFSPEPDYHVLFPAAASQRSFGARLHSQFYVAAVPLLCGLLLVLSTFAIARQLFDYWTALMAMFLMAISPAVLLASQKIWADTLLASLVAASFLFFIRHLQTRAWSSLIAAAVCFAGALLTKNTAILVVPALGITAVHFCWCASAPLARTMRCATTRTASLLVLALVLTWPWYFSVYTIWGAPMHDPITAGSSAWFTFLKSRPWYTYLVSIPAMVPLFSLGFLRCVTVFTQRVPNAERVLAVWFGSFLGVLMLIIAGAEQLGPDSRYMLPAYPPLAILSAIQLLRITKWLAERRSRPQAYLGLAAALLLCVAWSYRLSGLSYIDQIPAHALHLPW